jgi:hypothetical protein
MQEKEEEEEGVRRGARQRHALLVGNGVHRWFMLRWQC